MIFILIGALLLSAVHASLPNHWITVVMLARAENWPHRKALFITAVAGLTHTVSTVIIGVLVGLVGWRLSQVGEIYIRVIAPIILASIGLIYLIYDLTGRGSHRHCAHDEMEGEHEHEHDHGEHDHHVHSHHHHHSHFTVPTGKEKRSASAVVGSLMVAMFFSPCLEIEAYYFTAAQYGWLGILGVSLIYVAITTLGMTVLVHFGLKGLKLMQWPFLEHHERFVAGIVLIATAVLIYFVKL